MTGKAERADANLYLEHGKPLKFGTDGERGIRLSGVGLEVVRVGENGVTEDDLLVWDAHAPNAALATLLAYAVPPASPTPIGVFRSVDTPSFESQVVSQIESAVEKQGGGSLESLLESGETWTVT
jgi:2-oxoglutarate ferredoxin oxidoreductase subunit beta